MKTSDFYYDLPQELIAQTPIEKRDTSRLMTLDRVSGATGHHHFYDLPDFLNPGDCLILNNSRVLPARLLGQRLPGGGACEVLLLTDRGDKVWECLVRPGRKLRQGTRLTFGEGALTAEIVEVLEEGGRLIRFDYDGIFLEILERLGKMPLPPYIKEELQDTERYQTVYSKDVGSAAAPTAGLHFTPELLEKIAAKGVGIGYVTLHVGLGTFRPVKEESIEDHPMHSEYCTILPGDGGPDQRHPGQRRPVHLRGHHLLPDAGVLGGGGRPHGGQVRLDGHLYLPRLPIQGDGRPGDQLPPARKHPHHAGVRLCRAGACAGRL